MDITRNTNYLKNNLVRFRGRVETSELRNVLNELNRHVESEGAKRIGSIITAVHSLHLETKVSDIEIFLPIDKKIPSTDEHKYMDKFELHNCITAHFKGGSCFLPNLYTEIYHRAKNMKLELEMPFYNVFLKDPNEIFGTTLVHLDIYVTVKNKASG